MGTEAPKSSVVASSASGDVLIFTCPNCGHSRPLSSAEERGAQPTRCESGCGFAQTVDWREYLRKHLVTK